MKMNKWLPSIQCLILQGQTAMDAAAEYKHANIVKRMKQERADRGLDHTNFVSKFTGNKVRIATLKIIFTVNKKDIQAYALIFEDDLIKSN